MEAGRLGVNRHWQTQTTPPPRPALTSATGSPFDACLGDVPLKFWQIDSLLKPGVAIGVWCTGYEATRPHTVVGELAPNKSVQAWTTNNSRIRSGWTNR